jgi:hypothetical protein
MITHSRHLGSFEFAQNPCEQCPAIQPSEIKPTKQLTCHKKHRRASQTYGKAWGCIGIKERLSDV